jgi:thioredoxin-like negative regulator of GroEL
MAPRAGFAAGLMHVETVFLKTSDYAAFINEREFTVILFDAPAWNTAFQKILPLYERAKESLGNRVNFAIVDVDQDVDIARLMRIANVPTVVYYHNGIALAALVGAPQDILARTRRIMAAQMIGYDDGL